MTLLRAHRCRTLAPSSLCRASVALALSLAALPAAAQSQAWIQQFGTSGFDEGVGTAPDGSGGVYVAGLTTASLGGPSAGNYDAWLARHDGAGEQLWIRQFGTSAEDKAQAAASDGAGGVYVAGLTFGSLGGPNAGVSDAWLAHYDSAGNQTWIRQLGTEAADKVRAAAPDGMGGVYVGGDTNGSLAGPLAGIFDAWFARYDSVGNQIWIRQLGTSNADNCTAMAPDGSGGVFVSGNAGGSMGGPFVGGFQDAWLASYDSEGDQVWIRQFGTDTQDSVAASAPDGSGGVYVSGITEGNLGGPSAGTFDTWLARYDIAGNNLWLRQLGTSVVDFVWAAAPDGSGGTYLIGHTQGSLGGPFLGFWDAWFARYDSAGNQTWIHQLGSSNFDAAWTGTHDGAGGFYVSGASQGNLGGPPAGSSDVWIARYEVPCGGSYNFCLASSTSIPGCQAALSSTGAPSLTDPSGFTISSGPVPGGNFGICFFGDNGPASKPFGSLGGQFCVQTPFSRTAPKTSGGNPGVCDGNYSFTLQDLIGASPIVVHGAVLHAELWARDPSNPDHFMLSNGLQFTVCP